ncbi:MAG TPA: protein kinase, partial [Polyangiales bacterium]
RGDSARPVPKVLDFGISKLTGSTDTSITQTGVAIGTPLYMSVEQLSGVRDIDARTDIYAFGVILYQAVTGQPPFQADTFPVLIAKIMTEHAVPPKVLRPEIPLALSRLIEWAMAKDRSARLSSMDELIRELEPFGTELGFRGQMTISGSDIPSVRTPASASSRAPAAQVVRTVPLKPALAEEAVAAPQTPVPSVRPREALLDTPGTLAPVITTPDEPAAEIPGQRRVGARAVAAVLVVVALLVRWWLLPHGQPADQHSAHIVVPATNQAMLAPITTPTVAPHVETTTVGAANTVLDPGAAVPPTTIPTTDGAAKAEQATGSKPAAQGAAGTVHAAHPPHRGTTTRKGAQLTAAAQTPVVTPAAAANPHVSTDSSSNTREKKASSGRFRAGVPDRTQFMSQ